MLERLVDHERVEFDEELHMLRCLPLHDEGYHQLFDEPNDDDVLDRFERNNSVS